MEKAILHSHITLTSTFVLFFLIKTILLLLNKTETLDKIRKHKWIDMVWGTLIIVTGVWYWGMMGFPHVMWLEVKIVLVLIAIALGIVSMKKGSKALALVTIVLLGYIYGVAETKSLSMQKSNKQKAKEIIEDIGDDIQDQFQN